MTEIMHSRALYGYILVMFTILVTSPPISTARDIKTDFQGYYSNKLKSVLDVNNATIRDNLIKFKKDKSATHLDLCYRIINQSVSDIDNYFNAAVQQLQETPDDAELKKLNAQIDKLEIITIKNAQLPFLCDRLYETGLLYMGLDKVRAKQCFRDIVDKFTSYEAEDCRRRAKSALDDSM